MTRPTVLVTGATGFLGRHVVARLLDDGYPVIALVRRPLVPRRKGLRVMVADLLKPATLRRHATVLLKCPVVIHLGGNIPRTPQEDSRIEFAFDEAVAQTRNLLECVRPRHFIFGSTMDVYGRAKPHATEDHPFSPQSNYAAAKVACEGLLSAWAGSQGETLTVLRFSHVYGPGDTSLKVIPRAMASVRAGVPPVVRGGGRDTRDYVYAADAAEAVMAAVKTGAPGVFHVASGRSTSIKTVVTGIINASGRRLRPQNLPSTTAPLRLSFDMRRTQRVLKFRATTPLSEGLKRTFDRSLPTIVFDLDGTLLDVERRYFEVYRNLAGADRAISRDRYWALKRRGASDRTIAALTIPSTQALDVYDRTRMRIIESPRFLAYDTLVPGAAATLVYLATRYRLILTTARQHRGRLLAQMRNLGIISYFDVVLSTGPASGQAITDKKTELIRGLKVPVATVIGDTPSDIEIARRLGACGIAVGYGIRTRELLDQARPDFFVSRPGELPSILEKIIAPVRPIWPFDWAEAK